MTFARANALVALAAIGGVVLFASDHPVHAWPLELCALLPLLFGLAGKPSARLAAGLGFAFGAGYTVPLVTALRFPPLLGGALALYVTVLWVVFALGARVALRWAAPWGALGVAAIAVILEWFDFTIVPVWGTAQSFVRVLSAAPAAIQFVSVTGMLGLVFAVVLPQALAVQLVGERDRRRRRASLLVLAGLVAVVAALDVLGWTRASTGSVTVAAIGYKGGLNAGGRLETIERLTIESARRGAELVVAPEVALRLNALERPKALAELARIARENKVALEVGYFDQDRRDNRIASFGADGVARDEYRKTHLIQGVERYVAGDGALVVTDLGARRCGRMICQDDNYTDLARAYGKAGVQVVAVPTNDWAEVAPYHLENALFRGLESRYAIVRAASNGTSVVASAKGEVLARHDAFAEGTGLALATVPLYPGGSLYATLGDLPFVVLSLGLLALAHRRGRGRGDTPRGAEATPKSG